MSTRKFIELPAALVTEAGQLARSRGDRVSEIVRTAILSATKAVERGDVDLVPQQPPRQHSTQRIELAKVGYVATAAEFTRCDDALEKAGSSRRAVAARALQAYVAAGGDRVEAVMPGERRRRRDAVAGAA